MHVFLFYSSVIPLFRWPRMTAFMYMFWNFKQYSRAFSKQYGFASLLHVFERVLINGHSVYARMCHNKNLIRLGNFVILNTFPIFCHFQEAYHHRKLGLGQDTFCLLQRKKTWNLKHWNCSNEKLWIFRLVSGKVKLTKVSLICSIWLTVSEILRLTIKTSGPCAMLPHARVINKTKSRFCA